MTLLIIGMALVLTGCDGVPNTARYGLYDAMTHRLNANIAIAEDLYKSGLINEDTKNNLLGKIDNIKGDIIKGFASNASDGDALASMELIANAIVDWALVTPDYTEPNELYDGSNVVNSYFITNCLSSLGATDKILIGNKSKAPKVEPLIIIDDATASEIIERMSYPIYVLNENVKLEEVTAFLNEYTNGTAGVEDEFFQKAANYFHELKVNGESVPLLDTKNKDNWIIQDSKSKTAYVNDDNEIIARADLSNTYSLSATYSNSNKPGSDLLITQHGDEFEVLVLRFAEFNLDAYNKIKNQFGLGEEQYMVVSTGNGGRVYMMQYPVGYVSGFETNEAQNRYEAKIEKSQLELNIKTGKIYKVSATNTDTNIDTSQTIGGTGTTGGYSVAALSAGKKHLVNEEDPYIYLSNGSPETSSFVIYGETGVGDTSSGAWNLKFGEGQVKASVARIVLRDYLEASYSPGVNTNEDLVVYGRKIRITSFEGALNTAVGWYCGIDGETPKSKNILYVSDFCDYRSLLEDRPYVKYIPNSTGITISTEKDEEDLKTKLKGLSEYTDDKIDKLELIAMDKVNCTVRFPSISIGAKDVSLSDSKPLFYAMVVSKNFQESGLMNWLTSESVTESAGWWNGWLKKHNYSYQIGSDELLGYLKNSYTFELNQAGIVVLNLETIAKIQQEYSNQSNLDRTHGMRTFFKVLGYCLVGYAFVLMMCWVVDTSVDLGLNTLNKASLGRFTAIAGPEEMPISSDGSTTAYVGFQVMLFSCLKIIAVGLFLIFLDIVTIVMVLGEAFGKLAQSIASLIGG